MSIQLITAPVVEPMDLAEAKLHLRQDIADDDLLIQSLISAARHFAHTETQRQIVVARYRLVLDEFCYPEIWLPKSPLVQIVAIEYQDQSGVWQTVPPATYVVDTAAEPARITPIFGQIWPIPVFQIASVRITFDAGHVASVAFDATADTVTVKGWKDLLVGDAVRFSNSGGTLPALLNARTDYYVQSVISSGVYKIAATPGGTAIDITGLASGTCFLGQQPEALIAWMKLRLAALYENREEVLVLQRATLEPLPFVDRLLDPYRVMVA